MSSSRTSLSTSDQDSLSEALIEDDFNIGAFNADRSAEQALISVLGRHPSKLPTPSDDSPKRYAATFEESKDFKEGFLSKKLNSSGSWRQYWFRFNPNTLQLAYFTSKDDALKNKVRRVINIGFIKVEKLTEEDELYQKQVKKAHKTTATSTVDVCTVRIHLWNNQRVYTLSAANDDLAKEWVDAMQAKVNEYSSPEDLAEKKEAIEKLEPLLKRHQAFQLKQFQIVMDTLENSGLFLSSSFDEKVKEGYLDLLKGDKSWKQYYVILYKSSISFYDLTDKKVPKGVISLESIFGIKIKEERAGDSSRTSTASPPSADGDNNQPQSSPASDKSSSPSPKSPNTTAKYPRIFTIYTPLRPYTFKAKHKEAMKDWILSIQQLSSTVSKVFKREEEKIQGESIKGKKVVLLFNDDKGKPKRFKIIKDTVTVGRSSKCDVNLEDKKVSRNHARIFVNAEGIPVLYDLGSMSGSFVNGKKATKIDLKNGDKMTFGETEIIFCVEVKQKKFLGIF